MQVLPGKSLKRWVNSMTSFDAYQVTVWDTQADNPYYILKYEDKETAKHVARSMKTHYVDDWGVDGETIYEVRLQKIQGESNG